jgi:hypothetical protein
MNAGRVPEDRTSGLTGGPQPRADGPGADLAPGRRPSRKIEKENKDKDS